MKMSNLYCNFFDNYNINSICIVILKTDDNGNETFKYSAVIWLYVITKIKTRNVYFQVFTLVVRELRGA
jgi:hypothetical protein